MYSLDGQIAFRGGSSWVLFRENNPLSFFFFLYLYIFEWGWKGARRPCPLATTGSNWIVELDWLAPHSNSRCDSQRKEGKGKRKKILFCCGERLLFNFRIRIWLGFQRFILRGKIRWRSFKALIHITLRSFIVSPPSLIVDLCLLACLCFYMCLCKLILIRSV